MAFLNNLGGGGLGGIGGGPNEIGRGLMRLGVDTSSIKGAMRGAVNDVKQGLNEAGAQAQQGSRFWSTALGAAKAAAIGTGVAAVTAFGIASSAAISYESAFAGVIKTLDASPATLERLRARFREMATEIPLSATEFARLGEAAGALGIHEKDIEQFVRVAALIGETTNVASDQAAVSLGQLGNVLDLRADDFERFGSALVQLGNNGASTEQQILEIASRSGAVGHTIGLSTPAILGFASAVADLGIEVEAGGSALQYLYQSLAAMMADEEKLGILAETVGITGKQFQQAFQEDAQGAIISFLRAMGEMDPVQQAVLLDSLGLAGVRTSRAYIGLAENVDGLEESIANSNKGWSENTALIEEARKRFATTASQIKLLTNRVGDLFIELGDRLLPALNSFVGFLSDTIPAAAAALADAWNNTLGPAIGALWDSVSNLAGTFISIFTGTDAAVDWGAVVGTVFNGFVDVLAIAAGWLTGIVDALEGLLGNKFIGDLVKWAAIWAGIRVSFDGLTRSVRWLSTLGRGTMSFLTFGAVGGGGRAAATGAAAIGAAAAQTAAHEAAGEARSAAVNDAVAKEQVRQQREAWERRKVTEKSLDPAATKLSSAATELATKPPARIGAAATEFTAKTGSASTSIVAAITEATQSMAASIRVATEQMVAAITRALATTGPLRGINPLAGAGGAAAAVAAGGLWTPAGAVGTTKQLATDVTKAARMAAFAAVQKDWGGLTFNPLTGKQFLPTPGRATGPYVSGVGTTRSLSLADAANEKKFMAAIDEMTAANRALLQAGTHQLGVFRDADLGRVDIDLTKIDDTIEDAMATQAARIAAGHQSRGAYDMATQAGVFADEASIAAARTAAIRNATTASRQIVQTTSTAMATGMAQRHVMRDLGRAATLAGGRVVSTLGDALYEASAPARMGLRGARSMAGVGTRIVGNVAGLIGDGVRVAVSTGQSGLGKLKSGAGSVFGAVGKLMWPLLIGQLVADLVAEPIGNFVGSNLGLTNLGAEIRDKGILPAIGTALSAAFNGINVERIAGLGVSEVTVSGVTITAVDAVRMGIGRAEMETMFAEEVTLEGVLLRVNAARVKIAGEAGAVTDVNVPELPPIPTDLKGFVVDSGIPGSLDPWLDAIEAAFQGLDRDFNKDMEAAIANGLVSENLYDPEVRAFWEDRLATYVKAKQGQLDREFRTAVGSQLAAEFGFTSTEIALLSMAEMEQAAVALGRNTQGQYNAWFALLLENTRSDLERQTPPVPTGSTEGLPTRIPQGVGDEGALSEGVIAMRGLRAQAPAFNTAFTAWVNASRTEGGELAAQMGKVFLSEFGAQIERGIADPAQQTAIAEAIGIPWDDLLAMHKQARADSGEQLALDTAAWFASITDQGFSMGVDILKEPLGQNGLALLQYMLDEGHLTPAARDAIQTIIDDAVTQSRDATIASARRNATDYGSGFTEGIDTAMGAGSDAQEKVEEVGRDITHVMGTGVEDNAADLHTAVRNVIKGAGGLDANTKGTLRNRGGTVIEEISNGASAARPSWIERLMAAVSPPLTYPLGYAQYGRNIAAQIGQGITAGGTIIKSAVRGVITGFTPNLGSSPPTEGPLKHPYLQNVGRNWMRYIAEGAESEGINLSDDALRLPSMQMPDIPTLPVQFVPEVASDRLAALAADRKALQQTMNVDKLYLTNARDEASTLARTRFLMPEVN